MGLKACMQRKRLLRGILYSNDFLAINWEKNIVEGRSVEFEVLIFLFF